MSDNAAPFTYDQINTTKLADLEFRSRRHSEWTDNYDLFRSRVITNRLTQRQSVNIPIMKSTVRGAHSKLSDLPQLVFSNKDNDGQAQLYANEYWKHVTHSLLLELVDAVNTKSEILTGRGHFKLNIYNGQFCIEDIDAQDVLFDRYMNPWDIESADHVIHTGIYRRIEQLEKNTMYDQEAIKNLKTFYSTKAGVIKADQNVAAAIERDQRLIDLGVNDTFSPQIGYTLVELNEHIRKHYNPSTKEWDYWVVVVCDDQILCQKKLMEVLGINFFPWVTWADDVERTDIYSDGLADIARNPNLLANAWWSQIAENRTLRNFGMQFYDSTAKEGWAPSPIAPEPWAWFPLPGDPNKVLKRVDVPSLEDSMEEIQFVLGQIESATSVTQTQKGIAESGQKTLGEIQLLAAKADANISAATKYKRIAWKQLGDKAMKMIMANSDKLSSVTLYKKSTQGNYFPKNVHPSRFASKSGYETEVTTKSEKDKEDLESIQKMQIAMGQFQGNPALAKIYQTKLLDLVSLVMEIEGNPSVSGQAV